MPEQVSRRTFVTALLGATLPGAMLGLEPARAAAQPAPVIRRQGNDSNCDWISAQNGVQNIGGDGERAYRLSRALVPQQARDYHEGFYTRFGPDGSDRPFGLDNLGAAPEAFVGVYEALGYDAVLLAGAPGAADIGLARAIYARLAERPGQAFAHLWTTTLPWRVGRTLEVPETGERVGLLYPYHEVVAFAAGDRPDAVVIVDGQLGRPYTIGVERLARDLRGFNRGIVVSASGDLAAHQRSQLLAAGQPYVAQPLGGVFLRTARELWGPRYTVWGATIGLPLRSADGEPGTVVLPGAHVHYERAGSGAVRLVDLGRRMAAELVAAGILYPEQLQANVLPTAMREWAAAELGHEERFSRSFGVPISGQIWVTQRQMREQIMRGLAHPIVDAVPDSSGYVIVIAERAMLAWSPLKGTFLVPLGRIYHEQLKRDVGL